MDIISLGTLLILLLVLPLLLYLLRLYGKNSHGGRAPLPPSPRGALPLLGHLHLLGALPHRTLRSLAVARGAPVMRLQLGRVPAVVLSSAAAAEEAMRARDLDLVGRPRSSMAERLMYSGRDVVFSPYGEYWRQARRVCAVHLLGARQVRSFRGVRAEEAAALIARVHATGAGSFDLCGLLVGYANAIISRAAFGDESSRGLSSYGGRELRELFADFAELLGTKPVRDLLPWFGWVDALRGLDRKVRRTFEVLDGVLDSVIDDHRRRRRREGGWQRGLPMGDVDDGDDRGDHRDFVDVLLDVNEMDNEGGFQLDTVQIKGIILDMFVAGTDATSALLEWAMAELVSHPCHMHRLQHELRAVVGMAGHVTEVEDHIRMDRLPYLKAVLKETLRLHSSLPLLVPRESLVDTEILGYHVAARTRLVINAWAIGRDPTVWGENAEEFMPERFLGREDVDYKGQGFEMIPFGRGRRGCPGIGFAMATVEMALASLLYHFDWEVAVPNGKGNQVLLDMSEMSGITVGLKHGLPLIAKPFFS
uniref:Cytochrome P450 n=1 Tax=Leersia perrieri TaxID=77586 RepID=A0A0D9WFL6_9ORYZ